MAIYETRTELAAALEGVGHLVYTEPKEIMMPPCVVLVPGSPYVSMPAISRNRKEIRFQLTLCVANNDNASALANLEKFIEEIADLIPTGIKISEVTQPTTDTVGSIDLLCCDFTLELTIN